MTVHPQKSQFPGRTYFNEERLILRSQLRTRTTINMFSKDDIPPHHLLAAAAPSRETFKASSHQHGPVLITRSPLESPATGPTTGSASSLATPLPFNTDELVPYDTELARCAQSSPASYSSWHPQPVPAATARLPQQQLLPPGPPCCLTPLTPVSPLHHFSSSSSTFCSGVCGIRIADLPSSNPAWFTRSGATLHIVMRGTFKRPLAAADLWTGQEFPAVGRWMPAVVLSAMYSATAKLFANTTWVSGEADESTGKVAGYMTPVLATAQAIHVAPAAAAGGDDADGSSSGGAAQQLPDLWDPVEDCRLLGDPSLVTPAGDPVTAAQRRKHLDRPEGLAGVTLRPGLIYTIHMWQSWCEPASYKIHLPGHMGTMSLLQFSIGIPLQIMAKDRSTGQYVVNLLMWHKGLLYRKGEAVHSGSSSWWGVGRTGAQQQVEEGEGEGKGSSSSGSGGKEGKRGGVAQRLRANLKAFTSLV